MPTYGEVMTGSVKFYDCVRRYGFIVTDSGSEIFFNSNYFRGPVPERGARVRFTLSSNRRGRTARDISLQIR